MTKIFIVLIWIGMAAGLSYHLDLIEKKYDCNVSFWYRGKIMIVAPMVWGAALMLETDPANEQKRPNYCTVEDKP